MEKERKMAFDLCLSSEIVLSPLLTLSAYDTMMSLLDEANVTSGFYSTYIEPKTKPNAIRGQVWMVDFVLNFNRETADSVEWPSTLFKKLLFALTFWSCRCKAMPGVSRWKTREDWKPLSHQVGARLCCAVFFREGIETRMRFAWSVQVRFPTPVNNDNVNGRVIVVHTCRVLLCHDS